MYTPSTAQAHAERHVAAVRDAPQARLALLAEPYAARPGLARYRRAAESFMRWQLRRGLLNPVDDARPGSPWWRAVNERLLRDQTEALARVDDASAGDGPPTGSVGFWVEFFDRPTPATWYRAHNASVVGGYTDALPLAWAETRTERFFMNVALTRVLYAHALVATPSLALGPMRPLAPRLGDPRRGLAGRFLALDGVLPDLYPLTEPIDYYLVREHPLARTLDLSVILPRLASLYAWSADDLGLPQLHEFARDGAPIYASDDDFPWPHAHARRTTAALYLVTRPSPAR